MLWYGVWGEKAVQAKKGARSQQRAQWGLSVGELSTVPVQIKVHGWSAGTCLDSEIFICILSGVWGL